MEEQVFWGIIEEVRQVESDDAAKMNEIAIDILSKRTVKEIVGFQTRLNTVVGTVYNGVAFVRKISNAGYTITDDTLVYFTQWLITQGEEYFRNILNAPELIQELGLARLPENEELSCIGEFAYDKRCELALSNHPSIAKDPDRFLLLMENHYYDVLDKIGN